MSEWDWTQVRLKSIPAVRGNTLDDEKLMVGGVKIHVNQADCVDREVGHRGFQVRVNGQALRDSWYEAVLEIGFIDREPFAIVIEPGQPGRRLVINGDGDVTIDYNDDTTRAVPEVAQFIRGHDTIRTFMFSQGAIVQVVNNGDDLTTYYGRPA